MNEDIKVQVIAHNDRKSLRLRWKDPITGKYKFKSARTSNRREAEREAGALEKALRAGIFEARRVTWEHFRERLRIELFIGKADGTVTQYESILDRVETELKLSTPRDLTPERIAFYATQLRKGGLKEPTVGKHLRHLRAVLRWAVEVDILDKAPKFRIKTTDTAKGRPLTLEEAERLIDAIPKSLEIKIGGRVPAAPLAASSEVIESWRFYVEGLYRTGLRLTESLLLAWDGDGIRIIDIDGDTPAILFPAALQKNRKRQTVPLMPDAVALLQSVPNGERRGRVFRPANARGPVTPDLACRIIAKLGKKAGIITRRDGPKPEDIHYATAHDLRRSFATRWAKVLMPFELAKVMRHSAMQTTNTFYVDTDSADIARKARSALAAQQGASFGASQKGEANADESRDSLTSDAERN